MCRILLCACVNAVPSLRGGFGGLSPPNKAPSPSNWNMKHYKSVEFFSSLNVKPPLHERKAPSHKRNALIDFLALVLHIWREVTNFTSQKFRLTRVPPLLSYYFRGAWLAGPHEWLRCALMHIRFFAHADGESRIRFSTPLKRKIRIQSFGQCQ